MGKLAQNSADLLISVLTHYKKLIEVSYDRTGLGNQYFQEIIPVLMEIAHVSLIFNRPIDYLVNHKDYLTAEQFNKLKELQIFIENPIVYIDKNKPYNFFELKYLKKGLNFINGTSLSIDLKTFKTALFNDEKIQIEDVKMNQSFFITTDNKIIYKPIFKNIDEKTGIKEATESKNITEDDMMKSVYFKAN